MDIYDYDRYILVSGFTHHNNTAAFIGYPWDESNLGLGVKFRKRYEDRVVSFGFGNHMSLKGENLFIFVDYQKPMTLAYDFGIRTGIMSTYHAPALPMFQPHVTINMSEKWNIDVSYQFPVKNLTPGVWFLNFNFLIARGES